MEERKTLENKRTKDGEERGGGASDWKRRRSNDINAKNQQKSKLTQKAARNGLAVTAPRRITHGRDASDVTRSIEWTTTR